MPNSLNWVLYTLTLFHTNIVQPMPVCLGLNGSGPKHMDPKYGAAKRHGVHLAQYTGRYHSVVY